MLDAQLRTRYGHHGSPEEIIPQEIRTLTEREETMFFLRKIALFGALTTSLVASSAFAQNGSKLQAEVFAEMFRLIDEYYVWGPVDWGKCRDDMARQLSEADAAKPEGPFCLDQHARFMNPERAEAERIQYTSNFGGVGIEIGPKDPGKNDSAVMVHGILPGTPASKSPIKVGDLLVAIQEGTRNILFDDSISAVTAIRGPIGSKITLVLKRGDSQLNVELTRSEIKNPSVSSRMTKDNIGYIDVRRWMDGTTDEIDEALARFRKTTPHSKVVLDVRNNPGGLQPAVLELLYLLTKDPKKVMVTDRTRKDTFDWTVTTLANRFMLRDVQGCNEADKNRCPRRVPGKYEDVEIVVLVNRYSASGSEMAAGAMKEWGYKVIADAKTECRTFGKGEAQANFDLPDGSVLHLTVTEFLVGNARAKINGVGVRGTSCISETRQKPEDTATERDAMFMEAVKLLNQ